MLNHSVSHGRLPDFLIIGAMKCGTTSLAYYLSLHPEIFMSSPKEINFFSSETKWKQGAEFYTKYFLSGKNLCGEASPSYSHATKFPESAQRIHQLLPQAKLIYLVRNPVDRAISNYVHRYSENTENRTLEEAFDCLEGNPYVDRSCYAMQLERYLEHFPVSQILVVTSEELKRDRVKTLRSIFDFLKVDDRYSSARFDVEVHQSSRKRRNTPFGITLSQSFIGKAIEKMPKNWNYYVLKSILYFPFSSAIKRPCLSAAKQEQMVAYFTPDVQALAKMTGRSFNEWTDYA